MKIYPTLSILCLLVISIISAHAQDDLLSELEDIAEPEAFEYPAFKAMKIANVQSTKVAAKGDMYMYVSHRFGTIKDGISTFYGLDNAITKIELVKGITDRIQIGASRESFRKTYALSYKMKLKNQTDQFPVNLVFYHTTNINTQFQKEQIPHLTFTDRLSYAHQLLISRRINNKLSLLVAPTLVRHNIVNTLAENHNQYALSLGGRYKLSKRISINADYTHNFGLVESTNFNHPLSIGMDIETGGHVFQLLFANSQSTNEPNFMSYATGDWLSGDIYFGFNVVRVF